MHIGMLKVKTLHFLCLCHKIPQRREQTKQSHNSKLKPKVNWENSRIMVLNKAE